MSKRAEEAALKAYPVKMTPLVYQYLIDQFGGKTEIDVNTYPRCLFQEGYEQAEKDLELTFEDMKMIDVVMHDVATEHTYGVIRPSTFKEFYEEVLRRFNQYKEERNS